MQNHLNNQFGLFTNQRIWNRNISMFLNKMFFEYKIEVSIGKLQKKLVLAEVCTGQEIYTVIKKRKLKNLEG